jgi:hypothetical protein
MELDDLKQTWNQVDKQHKPQNRDIMELIQHKSNGPVAALKKAFRKQIRRVVLIGALIFIINADDVSKVSTNTLFWCFIIFCSGISVFFYYNYQLVNKMEGMDEMIKSSLQKQVTMLETRLRWHITGLRLVVIFFIILLEILPYFQHIRMLDKWHSISPIFRFMTYGAFLIFQYYMSRRLSKRRFGQHLAYLKELVKEMQ